MAAKLMLDLPLVLPDAPDERDACVGRLTRLLQAEGLEKVHLIPENGSARLCLHYDPQRFSVSRVRELAQAAGAKIGNRFHHENLRIDGMDCPTCGTVIEHALQRTEGVLEASVSYAAERLRLEFDSEKIARTVILARIQALGYAVLEEGRKAGWFAEHRELIFSGVAGLFLLAGWLAGLAGAPRGLALGLLLGAYAAGGFYTLRDAWQSLRSSRFDIDTLMIVAAAGAAALGAWEEGALLLFLFSLGHALEHMAMDRARKAIEALAELAPKTAIVQRAAVEIEVRVEDLQRGDRVIVKPGQRIPADGQVTSGDSAVDQSPVTGESMPVDKQPGDKVFAATVNGEGALVVEVTKLARESTLSRMVEMVAEAQTQKSPTQRFTDRFERIFVPAVLVGVGLLIMLPPLFGFPFAESFYRAMAVLVAASPCALAIATPSAVLSGIARAARGGVLIKGGVHLENLGVLTAIAFDKTGTLTVGKPKVTDVVAVSGDETLLLTVAAAVESRSAHPLAQAVVTAAKGRGLSWGEAGEAEAVTGKGVRAEFDGQKMAIGNAKLFDGESIPDVIQQQCCASRSEGKTIMLIKADGQFLGVVALADTPREGVKRGTGAIAADRHPKNHHAHRGQRTRGPCYRQRGWPGRSESGPVARRQGQGHGRTWATLRPSGHDRRRSQRCAGHGARHGRHRHGRRRHRCGAGNRRRGADGRRSLQAALCRGAKPCIEAHHSSEPVGVAGRGGIVDSCHLVWLGRYRPRCAYPRGIDHSGCD